MEEESQPADPQPEPEEFAGNAAAVAAATAPVFDVYMDDEEEEAAYLQGLDVPTAPVYDAEAEAAVAAGEEADRQAAMAADEELAHALHMHDLMEMEEWGLRDTDLPSLRAALQAPLGGFPASSGSGVGSGGRTTADNFWEPYVPPPARRTFESIREADRGTVFLRNSRIPGPIDSLARLPNPSNVGVVASSTRQTILSEDAFGSSSSQQVPGDGREADTEPIETPRVCFAPSAGCGARLATSPRARPIGPADDPVAAKRWAVLADAASSVMIPAMEEGHDYGWYESIVRDSAEKLEQAEKQHLDESLQLCLPRSDQPCKPAVAAAAGEEEEEEHGFSLPKFCQRWGVSPSELEPDAPGPSTTKVPPLADDEVPTFHCGICMDTLPAFDLFHGLPCRHKFCATCMTTYVEGRIRASELPIPCPDPACKGEEQGVLHPEKCKKAIDYAAFGEWGARLTEGALPPDRRAYCPNRRCGELLETSGGAEPAMAPCPTCKHLLCATCGMEWSPQGAGGEHDCARGPDAALVRKLAQERRWKQCPSCLMFVERSAGCNRMTCRCRFVFCYQCGRPVYRGQAGAAGQLEPCRCHDAGLAFAFAYQHQAHRIDVNVLPPAAALEVGLHQPGPEDEPDVDMEDLFG